MNIVVLDGYTLNPGDLSWDGFESLGNLTVHDRTPAGEVVSRAQDAEIVMVNKVELTSEVIQQLPQMKYIGELATGFNNIDLEAARERDIPVTNIPTYGTTSVAQMVFAHLLELTQHVAHHDKTVREGRWTECPDFSYWDFPMIELNGLTLGLIGLGRIGQATAKLGQAFGMDVIAYDVADVTCPGVDMVTMDEVFKRSDVVSLHTPLTPEAEKIVNRERLKLMKPTAFLINTSRGPVVDGDALADALNNDKIAGAGLDVLPIEQPSMDAPLMKAKNCHITPHIAWATRSARSRLMDTAVDNLKAFLDGRAENVVN